MNGLQKMTERILADARAEAEAILAEAERDCEEIRSAYAARAEAIRERLSLEAEAKGADMVAQARSGAAVQRRNLLLRQQSELLEATFSGAEDWILNLPAEKYADVVGGLLSAALCDWVDTEKKNLAVYGEEDEDAGLPFEVILNKKDRETCGEALLAVVRRKLKGRVPEEILADLCLSRGTRPIKGGAVLSRGALELNCSFEIVFAQLRRELESEVGRVLLEVRGSLI